MPLVKSDLIRLGGSFSTWARDLIRPHRAAIPEAMWTELRVDVDKRLNTSTRLTENTPYGLGNYYGALPV